MAIDKIPQLLYPFHSNIQECEGYTMGMLIPYWVGDIHYIINYIEEHVDKQGLDKAYALYGDCIITHMVVIKQLNKELFDNKLDLTEYIFQ